MNIHVAVLQNIYTISYANAYIRINLYTLQIYFYLYTLVDEDLGANGWAAAWAF